MVGSVDAPEPGFRPGARWGPGTRRGFRHALGALACAGGLWRAGGPGMRWGPGARWRVLAHAGALACVGGSGMRWRALARWGAWHALGAWCALAGSGACWGSGARRGFGVPWRLTRSRLCLGWCCGLRVVAGLPVCGAARGGERHVLLRSYVVGVHWMRAYACVALGEWRTDAASEEVYVGAGGGIASVA